MPVEKFAETWYHNHIVSLFIKEITDELYIASSADSDVRRFIGEIRTYAFILIQRLQL